MDDACEDDIRNLCETIPGPFPLLHALTIEETGTLFTSFRIPPLFQGALNVQKFVLHTDHASSLFHFAFPNLTILDFRTRKGFDVVSGSLLLDFLEASPLLQKVNMVIPGNISCASIHPDKVAVLPCVKYFSLTFLRNWFRWGFTTHLSCPSAEHTMFRARAHYNIPEDISEDIYPPSQVWSAITQQYARDIFDEVELRLKTDQEFVSSFVFRSSNKDTLGFHYNSSFGSACGSKSISGKIIGYTVFSRASRILRDHPQVGNVRRLYIQGGDFLVGDLESAANDIGKLLGSLGFLERLCLDKRDPRPFLDPFLKTPLFPEAIQSTSFPSIKELTIISPIRSLSNNKTHAAALIKLAKSQSARGVPFEHMTLRPPVPSRVVERLMLSVHTVVCGEVLPDGGRD